jgi:hypothetical protein
VEFTIFVRTRQLFEGCFILIIGIGHRARRGKDTAAQAIIDSRPDLDIRRFGFGDAVKEEVNEAALKVGGMFALFQDLTVHGVPLPNGQRLTLPDWVKYDPNPSFDDLLCPLGKQRTLLQFWGSEYRRGCDKFYWIKAMKATLEKSGPIVALIPDIRFVNEVMWVKANGGFTIRCERTGFPDLETNSTHHSERELDAAVFDYTITVGEGETDVLKADAVTVFGMIVQLIQPVVEMEPESAAS